MEGGPDKEEGVWQHYFCHSQVVSSNCEVLWGQTKPGHIMMQAEDWGNGEIPVVVQPDRYVTITSGMSFGVSFFSH